MFNVDLLVNKWPKAQILESTPALMIEKGKATPNSPFTKFSNKNQLNLDSSFT